MHRLSIIAAIALLAAACAAPGQKGSPLNYPSGLKGIPFTTNCVARDENGKCTANHCKADEESDCTDFAGWCLDYDSLVWDGNKQEGTCSQPQVAELQPDRVAGAPDGLCATFQGAAACASPHSLSLWHF